MGLAKQIIFGGSNLSRLIDVALRPTLSTPLLLALLVAPAASRGRILQALRLKERTARRLLQLWFTLSLLRSANRLLTALAVNNGRLLPREGWSWSQEIAVVTGGCGGIGQLIAKGLSSRGVRVVVLDLQEPPKLLELDDNITFFHCDVSSATELAETAKTIRETLGNPSILINNAGIGVFQTIANISPEVLTKAVNVNLVAHWTTAREFLPSMVENNKGHIVGVGSFAAFVSLGGLAHYCAPKAGAVAFYEALRHEISLVHRAPGVLTTVVFPWWVRTPMVSNPERIAAGHGPLLSAEEVAAPIVNQVFSRKAAQLVIPEQRSWLSVVRYWPMWAQDAFRTLMLTAIAPSR